MIVRSRAKTTKKTRPTSTFSAFYGSNSRQASKSIEVGSSPECAKDLLK